MRKYVLVDCMGLLYGTFRVNELKEAERIVREQFPDEFGKACFCCGHEAMRLIRVRRRRNRRNR